MKTKLDRVHPQTCLGLEECEQTSALLSQTIRQVHGKACLPSPVVAMLLAEALVDACELERRLKQLSTVAEIKR